ncbi:hypothetical protein Mal4_08820 [Maioricimonas rarisocia]|uniref:Uncharacterized protein n=1 Tax=Maioricimonas rarisocia TaxID=2528026 RepID=A0A517Z298_9PLAN|nr:hypothetical protein [Maioricimonas rarisocia]QDU36595.1 hypothetical protein Mal4_08820 [Maioricimonas rarisocia]
MTISQHRLCTVLLFCFTALIAPDVNADDTSFKRQTADSPTTSAPTVPQVAECHPDLQD